MHTKHTVPSLAIVVILSSDFDFCRRKSPVRMTAFSLDQESAHELHSERNIRVPYLHHVLCGQGAILCIYSLLEPVQKLSPAEHF